MAADAVALTEEAFGIKLPVVAATKDDLVEKLRPLVESFELRKRLGEEGRAYVEKVHGLGPLTDRLLAIYAACEPGPIPGHVPGPGPAYP